MTVKSEANALSAIADIKAVISTCFQEIEPGYRIPMDIVNVMKSAGVFRMFIPQRFGGLELELPIIIDSLRELSRADASVGWTAMIGAGSALFATMLPLEAFERIYKDDPDAIIAGSTQMLGTIEKRGDTWHASGQWPFASGCLQASWMLGFCTLATDDKDGTGPQVRVVILPASRWRIKDTWRVPGLKGTGSHDIALDCPVSPETDFFDLSAPERWISGPLYAGVPQMIALMHGAVSLGIAEGALDDLLAIAASGRQQERAGAPMRDTEAFQRDIGQVHADIRAARAALKEQTESHWRHAQNGTLATGRAAGRGEPDRDLGGWYVSASCRQVLCLGGQCCDVR